MAGPPPYQPYLDVPAAPFRWRLGLRPLDLADWLDLDDHYPDDLARKAAVMANHPTTAFRVLDDVDDAATEVHDAIDAHLRSLDDPRVPESDPTLHPLDAAARRVQEDLVVLVERGGRLVCGGGSVCFPNRWDLASKVGRTMSEIHAPVARLNDELAAPIDGFLDRLTPERSFWRLGWGVLDTDDLYQPVDGTAAPRPVRAAPGEHHLRVERETLRRFPTTGCVLFTIRTYVAPLTTLLPTSGVGQLADALDALPDDVAAYKQLESVGPALARWLRQAATAGPSAPRQADSAS